MYIKSKNIARWEKGTKYYMTWIQQDLFGDWYVFRVWGVKNSLNGEECYDWAENEAAANRRLDSLMRMRLRDGYHLASP
ncbi:WGR domain-containing protein [Pseudogulbenkiania subflava]|uniref:WGR domain-containing protein n=1 Tax=Pseudogulbenkiania subflava TaxID=451637 RepID=UPI00117B6BDC